MQIERVNLFSSHCQRGEGCKADLKHTDFHIFINLSISFNLSTKVVLFITFLCNICICFFFRQALQQYKGDATSIVTEIINTIEGGPPVDVSSVRSM